MPNLNITDSRNRDAIVKAESVRVRETFRYVGPKGLAAWSKKILKSTMKHDLDALQETYGDFEAIGQALIDGDPEVDLELFGQTLWNVSRVYVNSEEDIVFRVEQNEIVRGPGGKIKEKRERQRVEANIDSDHPIRWTGKMINKLDAIRRYVFVSKLQIVHINGLTYDFLHGMAKELSEANSMMLVGAGPSGRKPLIFRRGSVPYRGFLEGRVDGDRYILLLHLSNLELKDPT